MEIVFIVFDDTYEMFVIKHLQLLLQVHYPHLRITIVKDKPVTSNAFLISFHSLPRLHLRLGFFPLNDSTPQLVWNHSALFNETSCFYPLLTSISPKPSGRICLSLTPETQFLLSYLDSELLILIAFPCDQARLQEALSQSHLFITRGHPFEVMIAISMECSLLICPSTEEEFLSAHYIIEHDLGQCLIPDTTNISSVISSMIANFEKYHKNLRALKQKSKGTPIETIFGTLLRERSILQQKRDQKLRIQLNEIRKQILNHLPWNLPLLHRNRTFYLLHPSEIVLREYLYNLAERMNLRLRKKANGIYSLWSHYRILIYYIELWPISRFYDEVN